MNHLRRGARRPEEHRAIQAIGRAYREIQQDMNRTFTDPYLVSDAARMKLLNARYEQRMLESMESALTGFMASVEQRQAQIEANLQRLTHWTALTAPLALLVIAGLARWSRRRVAEGFVRPVAASMAGAESISRGRLEHRVAETGATELASLAHAVNRMAAELASGRAALGELVPVVSHNIRNPLAGIRATTQLPDERATPEGLREARLAVRETVDRLERWLRSLLCFLHPAAPQRASAKPRAAR